MRPSKIHKGILKKAVPYIEERCRANNYLSEYDIKDELRRGFKANNFRGLTNMYERENRSDFVVYNQNNKPIIIYELKTYFKDTELFDVSTAEEKIKMDLQKLAERKNEATGYFLFVSSKEMFEQCKEKCSFEFITELANQGTEYKVQTITKEVTIIAKRKEITDNFIILSWFVKKL